jgi:ATP-dependent protease ClpP protease subunit
MKLITALFLFLTPILSPAQVPMHTKIVLSTANTVSIRGPIDGGTTTAAIIELIILATVRGNANYPLYLVLDTPGGEITSGLDFIEFAKTIPNLHTISLFAASMGSAIQQSLPGKRFVTGNSTIMFHKAKGTFSGEFETGEVESQLRHAKVLVNRMQKVNASRMKMTIQEYEQKVTDEWWVDSSEAVQLNVADELVDIYCTVALINKKQTIEIDAIIAKLTFSFSGCPLLRLPMVGSATSWAKHYNQRK